MSVVLPLLLFVIFIAVVASLYTEGMWGNAIMLINVVTAGLIATNYFEPMAGWLEGWNDWFKSCTYLMDFLSLWLLFVVAMIVLRLFSDKICRVKVRFLSLANQIGSVVFACLVALVVLCFTTFTLHTAPLGKNFMYGAFKADQGVIWGWAPDQWWIYFSRMVSNQSYCRMKVNMFDRTGQFTKNYETRRIAIETHVESTQSIRVN
ncbi:MAG TPA: CvpA family protein [Thermoguttaceae bacterium]|nr:CvpA family protein [Thermoguttaceae bacterium]